MKLCPQCQTRNSTDNKFCQQCGKPLVAAPVEATIMMSATQLGTRAPRQQNFDVAALFGEKSRVIIGRAADCDLALPHPSVSRYHARIERHGDGLYLADLSSVNGVWLSGRRISDPTLIREGDRVGIGPFLLSITHGVLRSLDNSKSLRLEARGLEKVITLPGGGTRKLLDDINLVVNPGEFVSLLGPSGSGKSTLMDCLNGRRRATGGKVLANGEDFYQHFDSFRQSLGYVPQKDIVHTQLTVYRALYYTARLRLPLDTEPEELTSRIEDVLKEMELGSHRDTLVANLSGGQIKRVSLGAELLSQPALLYIDEATSGLDAGTEARMMRLFRRLSDEGRSIICITHNVDNVEQCHLVLVLARGKLIYYGPPREAPAYFKVKRLGEVYDRVAERDLGEWEREFRGCSLYREFVLDRLESAPPVETGSRPPAQEDRPATGLSAMLAESRKIVEQRFPPLADYFRQLESGRLRWRDLISPVWETWHQMRVLTARYVELLRGDRRGLRLLLLQAPIVALFLLVGFIGQEFTRPMPLLRPLRPEERQALRVLRGLNGLLDSDQALTEEQRKALQKIQLQIAGFPVKLDGNGIVLILRRLLRKDLSATEQAALEQARFVVEMDNEPMTVSGADIVRVCRQLQEARLSEHLLQMQGSIIPRGEGINPRFTYILLFLLSMIVMWFGCNNAAKEIVKEEAIYGRERAVNLRIVPYLASKFIVLSIVTILHSAILMLLLYGPLELLASTVPGYSVPAAEHMLAYPVQFGVFVLLGMTGVALGLLLSACVSSPDRANALLPYVLIPQMILGGGIVSVQQGTLYYLAALLSPVYWGYRAVHRGANELPPDFPGYVDYLDGIGLPSLALVMQMFVLLALTWWFMKRKDV
jgi:ABC-type multidrug transport system ATPase subunit